MLLQSLYIPLWGACKIMVYNVVQGKYVEEIHIYED
jgi:hypothetical protein